MCFVAEGEGCEVHNQGQVGVGGAREVVFEVVARSNVGSAAKRQHVGAREGRVHNKQVVVCAAARVVHQASISGCAGSVPVCAEGLTRRASTAVSSLAQPW